MAGSRQPGTFGRSARMTARAKWIGLIAAAMAVAGSLALVELARSWPIWLATWGRDARRAAEPSAQPNHFVVPLVRRSPAHVVVTGAAYAVGLASWRGPRAASIDILLDTGASLPLLTSDGARALRPATAERLKLELHGFAGHRVNVVPLGEDERLQLTLAASTGAGPVITPVWHALADALHGAHVILPPTHLAPRNGAVLIDPGGSRFMVCESLESCLQGAGWTRLARKPCEANLELLAVDAAVDGHPARLMLDTGGHTLLFSRFYTKAGLAARESSRRMGTLIGAGDTPIDAARVRGSYRLVLGVGTPVPCPVPELWVAPARERSGPVACFPDGAIGLDVLGACEIVISEASPRQGYLRCP